MLATALQLQLRLGALVLPLHGLMVMVMPMGLHNTDRTGSGWVATEAASRGSAAPHTPPAKHAPFLQALMAMRRASQLLGALLPSLGLSLTRCLLDFCATCASSHR